MLGGMLISGVVFVPVSGFVEVGVSTFVSVSIFGVVAVSDAARPAATAAVPSAPLLAPAILSLSVLFLEPSTPRAIGVPVLGIVVVLGVEGGRPGGFGGVISLIFPSIASVGLARDGALARGGRTSPF